MRRTKIICTLGPAVDDENIFLELAETGFDVARLNFSHGSFDEHKKRITMLKEYNQKNGDSIAILLDTKGPEIRTGIADSKVYLEKNQSVILTTKEVKTTNQYISISYKDLPKEVSPGNEILLDDGLIALEV